MKTYDRYANLFSKIPGLGNLWARRIVALLVGLIVIGLVLVILIGVLPLLPARFWQLLGLCLIVFGVIWWFTAGARRYSRQGFSKKRIGDLGPGNPDDEREPLARMTQAMTEAKSTILRSPEIEKGRDPVYRVPWMLFLGDGAANVNGLLKAANTYSTFPPPTQPENDPNQLWRWWFFKSMIAIETHPRIVCDAAARLDRGLWYQALTQLAIGRDRLPLNGIALCIAAKTLLAGGDELKTVSLRLRRLVDEAMEHLQAQLPVYFIVTGLEQLPGYAHFRATLPQEAFAQALGHRLPETAVISAATSGDIDSILQPITDRLHALRISALRAQSTIEGRRGVFEFVESLRRLSGGLRSFVALQLEDNPFQRTPRWRGLYFTGAAVSGAANGAFIGDLFTRFLPGDQPLATPSFKGKSGKFAVAGLGVIAMLGLSGYLSYGLSTAKRDDTRLLAQTRAACQQLQDGGAGNRITSLANCGRTIEQLQASADDTALGFGIRKADQDIERLKTEIVSDFSNLILAPYDQALESDLAQGRVGIDHIMAVAQRLRMLGNCRSESIKCQTRELPHNVVFDPASRLFAPFAANRYDTTTGASIAKDVSSLTDSQDASALMSTYFGYLRWQKDDVLDAEEKRLKALLGRILSSYTPRVEDLERWALAHADGPKLTDFWLPEDRVVGVESGTLPIVSAAYTLETWQGVMKPMLDTAGAMVPEKKNSLADFRDGYFTAYFRSWAQFQSRFGEGLKLWQGHYGDLTRRAASHENPYRFFFKSAERNLFGLPLNLALSTRWTIAWADARSDWLGAWRPLSRFVSQTVAGWFAGWQVTPAPWVQAMKLTETSVLRRQEALFSQAWLRLDGDGSRQDVYQIVADLWRAKGLAAQPPASTYTQLLQSVDKPEDRFASTFKNDDLSAWSIVQGPSRLLLFLTVYRAGEFVQAKWQDSVVTPLHGVSPKDQLAALTGPQGKLAAFIEDWLKPFVTERERAPVKIAGIAMPLSAGYTALVAQDSSARGVPGGGKPFLVGNFQFTGPSQFGTLTEGAQGTALEVECQDRLYTANSHAESLADAKVALFWSPESCPEARLRISLPVVAAAAPAAPATPVVGPPAPAPAAIQAATVRLTRIYSGVEGLATLISDFKTGSKSFPLGEFQSAYTPQQWNELVPQLRALNARDVRVFLDIRLSDDMQRFLAGQNVQAALPASILE